MKASRNAPSTTRGGGITPPGGRKLEIPVAGVEGSLGGSLVERQVGRPKQRLGAKEAGAKEAERSGCRKHAGAFDPLRERTDHG